MNRVDVIALRRHMSEAIREVEVLNECMEYSTILSLRVRTFGGVGASCSS